MLEKKDIEKKDIEKKDIEQKDIEYKDIEYKDIEYKDIIQKDIDIRDNHIEHKYIDIRDNHIEHKYIEQRDTVQKEIAQIDVVYMEQALKEAYKALELDETPIGAIITRNGEIIASACNRRNTDKNPLYHAEMIVINKAAKVVGDWRLEDCTLYITLEPCPMCAGAIVQARIPRVVFGARSPKAGFAGSVINILQLDALNHQVEVVEGVCKEECSKILKDYFRNMREKRKKAKE